MHTYALCQGAAVVSAGPKARLSTGPKARQAPQSTGTGSTGDRPCGSAVNLHRLDHRQVLTTNETSPQQPTISGCVEMVCVDGNTRISQGLGQVSSRLRATNTFDTWGW